MKPVAPCKNCQSRTQVCHMKGNCEEYEKFREDYDNYINKIKTARDADALYSGYASKCRLSIAHYVRNHKVHK